MAHCRHDVAKVCERCEDLRADQDVLLDVFELFWCEGSLLVQHRLAGADLADVVQPARHADVLDVLVRHAELMGNRSGEVCHPGRVATHVGVFRLEGVDQRLECGDREPLQFHAGALQLRALRGDLLLEPLVELAVLEQHLTPLERPLDGARQVGELDRLGQVVHGAALHAQGGAGGIVYGREHEDGELGLDLDCLGHEVDPAGAGHADVAQHERYPVTPQLLQSLVA